jgi:hypothetical protein
MFYEMMTGFAVLFMLNVRGPWTGYPRISQTLTIPISGLYRYPRISQTFTILTSGLYRYPRISQTLTIPISGLSGPRIRSDAPIPTPRVIEDLPSFWVGPVSNR